MPRATRQELESENEYLRNQLEAAQKVISEALGYDVDQSETDDEDDDEEEEEEEEE